MEKQVLPIDFGGGIDSKTDPKLVVPGKMLLLENATFKTPKRITKRNGYTALPTAIVGGGNLVSPQMVKSYNGELICQDSGNLYSFSEQLQAWVYKGPYLSVELTETFLYKEGSISGHVDCAVLGNIALYVWSTSNQSPSLSTMAAVVDLTTGTTLLGPTVLSTITAYQQNTTSCRAVVLGSLSLAVTYLSSTTHIAMRILTVSASGVSFGSEVNLAVPYYFASSGPQLNIYYDIVNTSTGAVIAYLASLTTITTAAIGVTGSVTSSNTITETQNIPAPICLCLDPTVGNVWVYWVIDGTTTGSTLRYAVYNAFISPLLSATTANAFSLTITNISALFISTSRQNVFVTDSHQDGTSGQFIDETWVVPLTYSSGSGSTGVISSLAIGVFPISKPFSVGSKNYMVFAYRGPTVTISLQSNANSQCTYFVLDLSTAAVVARFASGNALSAAIRAGNWIANVAMISPTKASFGCGIDFQLVETSNFLGVFASQQVGAASVTLDFASLRAYRPMSAGEILVLNGALVSAYDGQVCSEFGFHLHPEIVAFGNATTGGNIGAGTYSYIAVFQWTDAQGNVHESETSFPAVKTISSGSTNTITVSVSMAYLSQKSNVIVALYRTQSSSSTYYLVSDPVNVKLSNPANYIVTLTDTISDTNLTSNFELYTTGNVVKNTAPPPSMIMEARTNRLYLVDSESPNTIWYTKSFQPGTGLSPSGLLTLQVDPKHGNIAGLIELDDKMIVYKDRGVAIFAGDGGNDTGAGATFTLPQFLPSDVGLTELKSLVLTPMGILFKSQKGFYLLDRAMGLHYHDEAFNGAAVEAYNAQSVTSAVLISTRNQIRILTASGSTLAYDYVMGQWSVFTNHLGYSADSFQNLYTYARTDGSIYQENATSFLDGASPYRLRAQLSWLSLASVHGFQRALRIVLLGDFANGSSGAHGVQISAAFDFGAFGSALPFYPASASSSGVLRYRERLSQQKCSALSLLIEEVVTGASGESIDFTSLGIEAGIKRGAGKLALTQTAG